MPKNPKFITKSAKKHTMSRFCAFLWLVRPKPSKHIKCLPKNINSACGICSLPGQPRFCLRVQNARNTFSLYKWQMSWMHDTHSLCCNLFFDVCTFKQNGVCCRLPPLVLHSIFSVHYIQHVNTHVGCVHAHKTLEVLETKWHVLGGLGYQKSL